MIRVNNTLFQIKLDPTFGRRLRTTRANGGSESKMLDTSGFGAAEVISLKVGDIGCKRMLIRVEAATFQCCTSASPALDQQ